MMDKQTDTEHRPSIEAGLEMLFTAPTPEPAFVTGLEQQLLARANELAPRPAAGEPILQHLWDRLAQSAGQHRWAMAALGLILVIVVALAAIGPQQVWADLQRLLGYAPGVGFVNLKETRVLTAPVEVTRDGVTLRVEQVLAGPDKTTVVIRSEGLPPEEELWPESRREGTGDLQARLRLPDGSALTTKALTLRPGGGTLDFPPLPDDIYRATLELPRLPLVPAGVPPENWVVPLSLRPATGELVAELFPQPYAPADASDTHHGITLRVLSVAHGPEETAVRVQAEWPNANWEKHFLTPGERLPELRDDLGHVYENTVPSSNGSVVQEKVERLPAESVIEPIPTPANPTLERTVTFASVSPSARHLTLFFYDLDFEVPAQGEFTIDLGDDPQVGDYWPLDVRLEVAGFPVHITGMRLMEEELRLRDGPMARTLLQFNFAPVSEQGDRALRGIGLDSSAPAFEGGPGGYNYVQHRIRAGLELREGQTLPTGPIKVQVQGASVVIRGPWIITWTVPGADDAGAVRQAHRGEARIAPVTLHPTQAHQTRNGLTLRVNEVTPTDRLTAVTAGLENPPPDVTLNRILTRNPETQRDDLYLTDDWGRRYAFIPWELDWQPPEQIPRPRSAQAFRVSETLKVSERLIFEPLQPLARRATLHVPAIAVNQADPVAFNVTVPAGVKTRPSVETVPQSESWSVDIPIEVTGHSVHFTEARLEERSDTIMLVLTSAPLEHPRDDRRLTGLQPGAVTAPDGRSVNLDSALGVAGPEYRPGDEVNGPYRMRLAFDVTDPETRLVQPGHYHVELAGAIVAVGGPWALSWNLPAP